MVRVYDDGHRFTPLMRDAAELKILCSAPDRNGHAGSDEGRPSSCQPLPGLRCHEPDLAHPSQNNS